LSKPIITEPLTNIHPSWLEIAKGEIGVKEVPGPNSNSKIIEYHKEATGLTADESPWCSAFVNWVMYKAGFCGTKSAMARSWLNWGEKIIWPREGCLVILSRGSDKRYGHVGFFVAEYPLFIKVLGGNQGNEVCYKLYPKWRVLSYRWPLPSDRFKSE